MEKIITLLNINDFTELEVVKFVERKLLDQNCKSDNGSYEISGSYSCMYRGNNGNKCAIGFLIPNELYNHDFENTQAYDVICELGLKNEISCSMVRLLNKLQSIHDNTEVADWKDTFKKLKSTLC